MPKVRLQRSGIDPVIGELEAAGVPQHVGVHLDPQASGGAGAFDHAVETRRRERCPALRYESRTLIWSSTTAATKTAQRPPAKSTAVTAAIRNRRLPIDLQRSHCGLSRQDLREGLYGRGIVQAIKNHDTAT